MVTIIKAATMKSVVYGMVLLFCGQTFAQGSTPLFVKVEDLENRLKAAEGEIAQLKSREQDAVIFTATLPSVGRAIGPANVETTLVYGNVVVNVGNAYNSITGIFTAPVSGVYYFSMFYHAGGGHPSGLLLYKNNIAMFFISDHQSLDTADNSGNAVFTSLQRGDTVYLRLPANKHIWSDVDATFSGFLVKAE